MPSIRRRAVVDDGLDLISEGMVEPESTVIVNSAAPPVESPVGDLPADLLNAPVGMDDDLAHALAARPPRRKLPGMTAFLGAAVLLAGGFLCGVLTQKHAAGSSTAGTTGAAAAGFRNRAGGTGTAAAAGTGAAAGGGAAAPAGAGAGAGGTGTTIGTTIGTVKLVDGSTLYLTATDGSIVRVTTGKETTIKVTRTGVASDLAPGTAVVVQGTTDPNGVVKATTVTQGGGFGAGGFGGGRTRTGTGTGGTGTGTGAGTTGTGTGGAGAGAPTGGNAGG